MDRPFRDRQDAGQRLAEALAHYRGRNDVLVLALPRGGIPVGYEVAHSLGVPLEVFVVRKLGVPWHEELAMGAIASGGARVLNEDVVRAYGLTKSQLDEVAAREQIELERREREYRDGRPFPDVRNQIVILVDDGLATGASMRAAVDAVRHMGAGKVVVAVPVGPRETCDAFRQIADEIICGATPEPFYGVGQWYEDFEQTTDAEVNDLLKRAHA
jgi:putative phosphoribosyl transferase